MKMHVDYDWSVQKLKDSPDDEECAAGLPGLPRDCVISGCPHQRQPFSNYCLFHETPADRERFAQRRSTEPS